MRSWSIPAGHLFGVDVRIHLIFFLLPPFIFWNEFQAHHGSANGPRDLALTGIILACVAAHECAQPAVFEMGSACFTRPDMVGPVKPPAPVFAAIDRGGTNILHPRSCPLTGVGLVFLILSRDLPGSVRKASSWRKPRGPAALGFVTTVDQSDFRGLVTGMRSIRQGLPLSTLHTGVGHLHAPALGRVRGFPPTVLPTRLVPLVISL